MPSIEWGRQRARYFDNLRYDVVSIWTDEAEAEEEAKRLRKIKSVVMPARHLAKVVKGKHKGKTVWRVYHRTEYLFIKGERTECPECPLRELCELYSLEGGDPEEYCPHDPEKNIHETLIPAAIGLVIESFKVRYLQGKVKNENEL